MKDKQVKKYIRKYIKWWVRNSGLGYWRVSSTYTEVVQMDHGGYDTAAVCDCDWRYQKATIEFSMLKMREMTKTEIEEVVVHELMHIFLNEMRNGDIEHEERCATQLAKAFMWIRDSEK